PAGTPLADGDPKIDSTSFEVRLLYRSIWEITLSNWVLNDAISRSSPNTFTSLPRATIFNLGNCFLNTSKCSFCAPHNMAGFTYSNVIFNSFKSVYQLFAFIRYFNPLSPASCVIQHSNIGKFRFICSITIEPQAAACTGAGTGPLLFPSAHRGCPTPPPFPHQPPR